MLENVTTYNIQRLSLSCCFYQTSEHSKGVHNNHKSGTRTNGYASPIRQSRVPRLTKTNRQYCILCNLYRLKSKPVNNMKVATLNSHFYKIFNTLYLICITYNNDSSDIKKYLNYKKTVLKHLYIKHDLYNIVIFNICIIKT